MLTDLIRHQTIIKATCPGCDTERVNEADNPLPTWELVYPGEYGFRKGALFSIYDIAFGVDRKKQEGWCRKNTLFRNVKTGVIRRAERFYSRGKKEI